MALCSCSMLLAPRCEYFNCRNRADWSVWQPNWGKNPVAKAYLKFMCDGCWNHYRTAMVTPMAGITRPEWADDEWKPSLLEHIRQAQIAIAFEERNQRLPISHIEIQPEAWEIKMFGWTPAQVEQVKVHRTLMRKFRSDHRGGENG